MTTVDPSSRLILRNCLSFPCFWTNEKENQFLEDLFDYISDDESKTRAVQYELQGTLTKFFHALGYSKPTLKVYELVLAMTNASIAKELRKTNHSQANFWLTDYQSTLVLLIWDSFCSIKDAKQLRSHYAENSYSSSTLLPSLIKLGKSISMESNVLEATMVTNKKALTKVGNLLNTLCASCLSFNQHFDPENCLHVLNFLYQFLNLFSGLPSSYSAVFRNIRTYKVHE